MESTKLTNLEVTGELKAKALSVDGLSVDGADDITAPTAAGDSYSKAQMKSVVDAVDAILELLGADLS